MMVRSVYCKLPRGVEEEKSHENTLSSEVSPPSQCCICLDTLGEADTSNTFAPCKLKPCAHIVCIDCLAQIRGRRCPMCRARMTAFRELTESALVTKEAEADLRELLGTKYEFSTVADLEQEMRNKTAKLEELRQDLDLQQ